MNDDQTELNEILRPDARIYFIGIGGIAMSAAAGIAKKMGYEVLGSDSKEIYSPAKDVLDDNDISYFVGYNPKQVLDSNADIFVLSAGEGLDNPEVKAVLENGRPHMSFSELLYKLTLDKLRVVIAGTHGKSTTTALIGHLLINLDDSSFLCGAVLQNYDSNFYLGDGHYFVFEGDEYKAEFDDPTPKFHYYKADLLVLTNLEYDHPDLFENFEALEEEFRLLISNMPEDGMIIYNSDSAVLSKLVHESEVSSVSFGFENEADFFVEEFSLNSEYSEFKVLNKFSKDVVSQIIGATEDYKIQIPGKHNIYNALAAIATLRSLGFPYNQIALDLLTFQGLKRRFEIVGQKRGIIIVDDYAHHPTKVKETLKAARAKYPKAKIWAVFEPHTFSRTSATLDDLAKSFTPADEVLISEIYPAREKISAATIKSEQVVTEISKYHKNVRLISNKAQALEILSKEAEQGNVVIVMAVGAFNRLAYDLKDLL